MPPRAVLATAVAKSAYGETAVPLLASLPVAETQVCVGSADREAAERSKADTAAVRRKAFIGDSPLIHQRGKRGGTLGARLKTTVQTQCVARNLVGTVSP